eukprot:1175694-Prorocentrum_minimum.AAC.4
MSGDNTFVRRVGTTACVRYCQYVGRTIAPLLLLLLLLLPLLLECVRAEEVSEEPPRPPRVPPLLDAPQIRNKRVPRPLEALYLRGDT